MKFFSFIKKNHYEFLDSIVKGDFSLLIDWFSKNIYSANYGFLEQLKKVTGRDLDIAIDLGTANTLVYQKSQGIVLDEPSVVARVKEKKS